LALTTAKSFATAIDFDSQGLTGPSLFVQASPIPQTIPIVVDGITVTFIGGVILDQTANLPADQTAMYGSASFVPGMSNPVRITFSQPVHNFFMNLYNGQTTDTTYRVSDNNGDSQDFTLVPNLTSGNTLVAFAATGTEVDITDISGTGTWDFFIDNIHFNQPLPTPDGGATVGLLMAGLVALRLFTKAARVSL
jgi:hypothetical protein